MAFRGPSDISPRSVEEIKETILGDGRFANLKNDEDRAKLIIEKHIEYSNSFCTNTVVQVKNIDKSIMYRQMGNKALTNDAPKLKPAFDMYCKSIAYAPARSRDLSLGYANRSAVLFRARFYEDCLADIEKALSIGYPRELQGKLFIRKAKCLYALRGKVDAEVNGALADAEKSIEKLAPVHDEMRRMVEETLANRELITSVDRTVRKVPSTSYVPQLSEENPKLPGASASIALKYSEKYGRHVVATRDIKPGEVLVVQKPYLTMIAAENSHQACGYCTKQILSGIPCNDCVYMMYCSEDCRQKAWTEYHDIECSFIASVNAMYYTTPLLLGVRMTIVAIKEAGSLAALQTRLQELDSIYGEKSKIDFTLDPNKYEMMYVMDDISDRMTTDELFVFSFNAIPATYFMATETNLFGKKLCRKSNMMKDNKWFALVAALTARNMKISNAHSTVISPNRQISDISESKAHVASRPVIYALVPLHCFFNNRCYSHAGFIHYQQFAGLLADVPMKKGEQVFICYDHYLARSAKLRQERFQDIYKFTCDCGACVEDWTHESCNSYFNQGLPPKVLAKFGKLSEIYRDIYYATPKTQEEIMKNITKLCKIIEQFYQHVTIPCVELFGSLILLVRQYRLLGNQYIPMDE